MLRKLLQLLLSWMLPVALEGVGLLRRAGGGEAKSEPAPGQDSAAAAQGRVIPSHFVRLLFAWLLLLVLGGIEFGISFLSLPPPLRPLVIIPGVLMVATVAIMFMEVGKGPTIVRGFAVIAMFWLLILLGLGSIDPLTRTDYYVPAAHVQ